MAAFRIHLFLKEGLESNNAFMPNLIMNQGSCDGSVEECQTNYSNDLGSSLLFPMLREQTQPGSRWLKRTRLGFIYFRECRAFGSQQIYLKRLALPRGKTQQGSNSSLSQYWSQIIKKVCLGIQFFSKILKQSRVKLGISYAS